MFLKTIKQKKTPQVAPSLSVYSPLLQRVLAARNVKHQSELDYSLSSLADYRQLAQVEKAATCLADAIEKGESVTIVGDFDADGATSTSLLMLALPAFGLKRCQYIVPNRFEYGYGLSEKIVHEIAKQKPDWILTVDNGISNHAGVALAKSYGINVIITDHHLPGETLPPADVIVNPNVKACQFPSKSLAGVGVAFYCLIALRAELRQRGYFDANHNPQNAQSEPNLAEWLDIVALGTVADVVPLDNNNRILVDQGLKRIRAGLCRPGITELLLAAKRDPAKIEASDLGFAVGPRLNAAGRLEDMSLGIECLLAPTAELAKPMVFELDGLNQYRREIESDMVADAMVSLSNELSVIDDRRPNAICLHQEHWHQGVVGLVASRVKERVNRPVIAFAKEDDEHLKGSGRSVPGVHLRDVLANISTAYPDLLSKFGGHAMAAGLSIASNRLDEFQSRFEEAVVNWLGDKSFTDEIETDGELKESELSVESAADIKAAGPWGQNFPEPLFNNEFTVLQQRIVGEKHLKLVVKLTAGNEPIDAIYFFPPEELLKATLSRIEIVYKLSLNEFRGETSLQLMIEQCRCL